MVKKSKSLFYILILLLMTKSVFAFDYEDLSTSKIPPDGWHNITWDDPGGWTTINVNNYGLKANDSSINATRIVDDIISSTSGRRILYFPKGKYYFKGHLTITTSNIRIKGDGAGNTELRLTGASTGTKVMGGIHFKGRGEGTEKDIVGTPSRGDNKIVAGSTSGISVGDFIMVYNKDAWFPLDKRSGQAQIVRITSKSGNTLYLDMKLGLNFDGNPKFREISMIKNVGIEKVKVTKSSKSTDKPGGLVVMESVYNGYIKEIEAYKGHYRLIVAQLCRNIIIEKNWVHHAWVSGPGSAYGISLYWNTTKSRVSDNKIWSVRNGVMCATGGNHNVISYNSVELLSGDTIEGEISFHGFNCHNNLTEGNMVHTLNADGRSGRDNRLYLGQYNYFFRNIVIDWIRLEYPSTSGNYRHEDLSFVGNIAKSWKLSPGKDIYRGNNKINGSSKWDSLNSGSSIPKSLYTTTKPLFLTKWPLYGPDVSNVSAWGNQNVLPARSRSRTPSTSTSTPDTVSLAKPRGLKIAVQ